MADSVESTEITIDGTHCDDYAQGFGNNEDARWFIFIERLPGTLRELARKRGIKDPVLFADYEGRRVRVTLASRFGDLGVSYNLTQPRGYFERVTIDKLTNFGTKP